MMGVVLRRIAGVVAGAGMLAGCGTSQVPLKGASTPAPAPVAPLPESFGTADPFTLLGFDRERRWVAMCQAREDTNGDGVTRVVFARHGHPIGDDMHPYFVLGGGAGEQVQDFMGADPTGDWVALKRNDRIELLNTRTRVARDLSTFGLDEEGDPTGTGTRTLSFSPAGGELMLLKETKSSVAEVLIVSLGNEKPRTVALGAGRVWEAGFSDDSRWLYANVVRTDSNGNGTLDLPEVKTTRDGGRCTEPQAYSTHGIQEGHDAFESIVVPLAGGAPRNTRGIQGHIQGDLVRQLEDGALVREAPSGSTTSLAPASCAGALDHYSLEHERWLVACFAAGEPRKDPEDGRPLPPRHLWLFGQDLPPTGKDVEIELDYGVEEGRFDTARFSRMWTGSETRFFDLKRAESVRPPEDMSVCAVHGDTFLLQAGGDQRDQREWIPPMPTSAPVPPRTYLWKPGSPPQLIAEGDCSSLGKEHARVGRRAFSWSKKRLVGDVTPLCTDPDCRSLGFRPVLDSGHFLLARDAALRVDRSTVERSLRKSLFHVRDGSASEEGPLEWQTWSAGIPSAPKAPSEGAPVRPAASCDVLETPISVQPSAWPAWKELQPFDAVVSDFPVEARTRDALPTGPYLQARACSDEAWPILEASLMRAARAYASGKLTSEALPAFNQVRALLSRCEPRKSCAMGLRAAGSDLARSSELPPDLRKEALAMAHQLMLSCDAASSRAHLLGDGVLPSLQVEWLVAGRGKALQTARNLEAALDATFRKEGRYAGQRALRQIAHEARPDVVQMILRLRERVTPAMFRDEEPGSPAQEEPAVDPKAELDLSLGTAKQGRLRALFLERCKALPGEAGQPGEKDYRCVRRDGAVEAPDYFHVDARPNPDVAEKVARYTAGLTAAERAACDAASGGTCPDIGLVTASTRSGTWEALYKMAVALSEGSRDESPLAGMLVDSPLRLENGKVAGALRAWDGSHLYESTMTQLAEASLSWPGAPRAEGDTLAARAFVGWLNAIAKARGDARRFAWLDGGGLVIVRGDALCTLTRAGVLAVTGSPMSDRRGY